VRQLVDGAGQVTLAQGSRPFGAPLWQVGSGRSGFGYTGEQVDASTGLVFLRARYYDPLTGRFLSRDPFPGYAAIPALQHPYVYALNNPLRYTDPNGEIVLSAIAAGAAIGGAIGGIGGAIIGGASYALTTDDFSWKEFGKSTLKGGVTGLAAGAVAGSLGAAAPVASTLLGSVVQGAGIGAMASGVGQGLDYVLTTDDFSWGGLGSRVWLGMRSGVVGGALGGAVGWGTNGLLSKLASRFGGVGALSDQAAWGRGPGERPVGWRAGRGPGTDCVQSVVLSRGLGPQSRPGYGDEWRQRADWWRAGALVADAKCSCHYAGSRRCGIALANTQGF
jgi:RHS repeat-associated protein